MTGDRWQWQTANLPVTCRAWLHGAWRTFGSWQQKVEQEQQGGKLEVIREYKCLCGLSHV